MVRLANLHVATKWLATTHGEVSYPTWDLEVHGIRGGKSGVSAPMASKILLTKCFGVRRLELRDFGRMSVRVLQSPGLSRELSRSTRVRALERSRERGRTLTIRHCSGLTSLHLLTDFPDKPSIYSSLSLPFKLRSLYLYNSSYRPELIAMLFHASSETLATLSLSVLQSSPSYASLVNSFHLIASSLRTLHINHRPSPEFIRVLRLCATLKHLSCNSTVDIGGVLDSVSCPIDSLAIELDYSLEETLRTLEGRMGAPSMAGLKKLRVKVLIEGVGTRLEELGRECSRREIALEIEARG